MELSVAHQLERWEKSSLMMKIRVIRIGLNYILDLASETLYGEYGLNTGKNTLYSITLNTNLDYFKNKNIYHPRMITAN